MMTIHKLGPRGWEYLVDSVAVHDEQRGMGRDMASYYTATENPPGVWLGRGAERLGVDGEVFREQMENLFGLGRHPDYEKLKASMVAERVAAVGGIQACSDARIKALHRQVDRELRLGRNFPSYASVEERIERRVGQLRSSRPELSEQQLQEEEKGIRIEEEIRGEREAVVGVDLVFSPTKSFQTAHALAVITGDEDVRRALEEIHERAWRTVIGRIESDVAYTRRGTGGVAQVDVDGVTAAGWVHRTSRAGDPCLHTHVTVSSKVFEPESGKWLSLDLQPVYAAGVSLSEAYNSLVLDLTAERLGWSTEVRADQQIHGSRGIREIVGIPEELCHAFASRRAQVEAEYDLLRDRFVAEHHREPTRVEQYNMRQQATLTNRPAKEFGSTIDTEVEAWRSTARRVLGDDWVQVLPRLSRDARTVTADQISDAQVQQWARLTVDAVADHRSTWTIRHLQAEAQRVSREAVFTSPADRQAVIDRIVGYATTNGADVGVQATARVIEIDQPSLIAEPATLRRSDGESVFSRHATTRYTTSEMLAAEDQLLAHARRENAPSISIEAVEQALNAAAFEGRPLAADQEAAVRRLAGSGRWLDVMIGPAGAGKTTTLRTLVRAATADGWHVVGLAPAANAAKVLADEAGIETFDNVVAWQQRLADGRTQPGGKTLLLVDEAGMCGTRRLRDLVEDYTAAGGLVRLIGDHRQLTAVEAGGALRYLYHEVGAADLSSIWRFRDPDGSIRTWEAQASLRLRDGDVSVIEDYIDHDRITAGMDEQMTDAVYADWLADMAAGAVSLMVADDNTTVTELSAKARADRVEAGEVEAGGVRLANGSMAGVGDRIVTRYNRRDLGVHGMQDWVKNGDVWTVEQRHADGSLTARHVRHGGLAHLPADYVTGTGGQVELAYATTVHRAQGLTVDRSRVLVREGMGREALYVAATRGMELNQLYVAIGYDLDIDAEHPPELLQPARHILARVLANEQAEHSAHESITEALASRASVATLAPRYHYVHDLLVAARDGQAATALRRALGDADAETVLADDAWPTLAGQLAAITRDGGDPTQTLATVAAERELDSAHSLAEVLSWRLTEREITASRPRSATGAAPWLPATSGGQDEHLNAYLSATRAAIDARAARLAATAMHRQAPWLQALGTPPEPDSNTAAWRALAATVAAYRDQFAVPDTETNPLGVLGEQASPAQRRAHALVAARIAEAQQPHQLPIEPYEQSVPDAAPPKQRPIPGWRERSYGEHTDRELALRTTVTRQEIARADQAVRSAREALEQLHTQLADGRGPAVLDLLEQRHQLAATIEAIEAIRGHADALAAADLEVTIIGRRCSTLTRQMATAKGRKRRQLTDELTAAHTELTAAQARQQQAALRLGQVEGGLPPRHTWDQLREQHTELEAAWEHALETARALDDTAITRAEMVVERQQRRLAAARQRLEALNGEISLREQQPAALRRREDTERAQAAARRQDAARRRQPPPGRRPPGPGYGPPHRGPGLGR